MTSPSRFVKLQEIASERFTALQATSNERFTRLQAEANKKLLDKIYQRSTKEVSAGKFEFKEPLEYFGITEPKTPGRDRLNNHCARIKSLIENEGFTANVLWAHPDCSYCEECGSGCGPTWMEVKFLPTS